MAVVRVVIVYLCSKDEGGGGGGGQGLQRVLHVSLVHLFEFLNPVLQDRALHHR